MKIKYPNRLTIPSETEIRQEISTLCNDSIETKKGTAQKKHKTDFTLVGESIEVNWKNELDDIEKCQGTRNSIKSVSMPSSRAHSKRSQ